MDGKAGDLKLEELLADLRGSPDDPITHNNLAVYYFTVNRIDDALKSSLRSVALDGKHAATRLNLAVIYDHIGQTERARQEAAIAAGLDPDNPRARGMLCELDLVLARNRESVGCYRSLIRDFKPQFDVRLKFAIALVKAGDLIEAESVLEKLRLEQPDEPGVLSTLANLYFRQKKYEKSAIVLKQAVEQDPDDARLRFNLAMSYLAARNRPGALSQYNLIKQSNPDLAGTLYRALFRRYILDVRQQAGGTPRHFKTN